MKKDQAAKKNNATATFDLEASLKALEELTGALEKGNLPLAEGLASFEKGMQIYQECAAYLAQAEQKIKVLADTLQTSELKSEPTNSID